MTDPLPPSDWLKLMLEEIERRKAEEAAAADERDRRARDQENADGDESQPSGDVAQKLAG